MDNIKRFIVFLFSLFLCQQMKGQEIDIDSELSTLMLFFQALQSFSINIPQEKVYLHFDNTGYYQGDHIWFKCYVTSAQHQLSELSKTLYVELLNPGGEVIDKRILKIEYGQCHGDFVLNQFTFYSGFYEVRAYTKYMLNFGDDVIFSRLLPVFDKPKTAGNYKEKEMLSYGRRGVAGVNGAFQMKREPPVKGKTVNLHFFPEGGNLIQGVTSRIAFEATDEAGYPINLAGVIMDANKQEIAEFAVLHEGRGVFTYTPDDNAMKAKAVVEYSGKKYQFDMPVAFPRGIVMEVDNLSYADSIGINLQKNGSTSVGMFGVAVVSGGKLRNHCAVPVEDDKINFKLDKTQLSAGVSRIVLFDDTGDIVCDRLIFIQRNDDRLGIQVKTDKRTYKPYDLVTMDISVNDKDANPAQTTLSLAVRDGENEIESNHTILTDLLLMSEIKGYVRNPAWYFENDNDETRRALDVLLMVQGWRRYSWKQMAGVEPFEMKHLPEQGIETHGSILSNPIIGKMKPQPDVNVDLILSEFGKDIEQGSGIVTSFITDSNGRFSFVSDVEGKWNMILAATEKGKAKNYRIVLDRLFSPKSKQYRYADMQVSMSEKTIENMNDEALFDDNFEYNLDSLLIAYQDSLSRLGIDEKTHLLEEVTVIAKKRTKAQDIYQNRTMSVAYYDVASEFDDLYDSGQFIGDNIHELMKNMNQNFSTLWDQSQREWLMYKNRMVLFVIDYNIVDWSSALDIFKYKNIRVQAIKSIYINETVSAFCQYYYHPAIGCDWAFDRFGCTVFIETYAERESLAEDGKGIRKTWLEGYSSVSEFYSPDYMELPPDPNDYRRTLYWNPSVTSDETGHAKIQFYNNNRNTNFSISAETVTSTGKIGICKY